MLWVLNELAIVGTWCYGVNDWPRVAAQIAGGRLPVDRVVTGRVALDGAEESFERLALGGAADIKVLVNASSA
jgi:threonine dehydrogenase-like Zn-dependent dehydrogenase